MTQEDVGAFLDGILPQQLAREDIAGAVVSVVKDGKVLFARGYGYADVEKKTPVSPDNTLFRPGSISKLFTWTAVMQLVEQGKLDLDRDVNDYIDYKIPATFPKPITLRNVMTHTPGFEETAQELFVADAKDMVRHDVHVDRAQLVIGAHQLHFFIACQITQIQDSQFAECNQDPEGTDVLGLVGRVLFGIVAGGIFLPHGRQGSADDGAI